MIAKIKGKNTKYENVFYTLSLVIFILTLVGQYYFIYKSLLFRIGLMIVSMFIILGCISYTNFGSNFLSFWQGSMVELNKVIWPNRKETLQLTFAVIIMVFVMGLILWLIDILLIKFITFLVKGAV